MQILSKLGRYLGSKRNFLIYSMISVGIPSASVLVWWFGHLGDMWFKLFMIVVALCGSLLWGLVMWQYFGWKYPGTRQKHRADVDDGHL